MEILVGIAVLLLAVWQGYASFRYFRQIQQHGTKATSSFALLAAWSGLVFCIILLAMGFMLITGQFSS